MRRAFRPAVRLVAGLALVSGLTAMMPPEVYLEARRDAAHHVQVELVSAEILKKGYGTCTVKAVVRQSFRGPLEDGDAVTFGVSCLASWGEEGPIVGGTMWTDAKALCGANYLEVFLNGEGDQLSIAEDQVEIIAALRDRPYCARDSFDCALP